VRIKDSGRLFAAVAILVAAWSTCADASVTEYTSQASYLAATSGLSTITFDEPSGQETSYSNGGLTLDGVGFVGYEFGSNNYYLYLDNESPNWGSGGVLIGPTEFSSSSDIKIALPSVIYAFGTNIMAETGAAGTSDSVTESVGIGANTYPVTTIAGFSSMAFVGFVSDTPITSVNIFSTSSDHVVIDNFSLGQGAASGGSSATPEISSSLLCGTGLLLLVQALRRRMRLARVSV